MKTFGERGSNKKEKEKEKEKEKFGERRKYWEIWKESIRKNKNCGKWNI
jgi:hypothetical protein